LPNSLTRVLPSPGYLLPPHLCRFAVRVSIVHHLEAFLGPRFSHFRAKPRHHAVGSGDGFPYPLPHFRRLAPQSTQRLTFTDASPHRSRCSVPDCLPVVHHLRLPASAKARLTRRGLTFRRKPRGFGACGSHTCFATHASILTCLHSTAGSPTASTRKQRSPTENDLSRPPKASVLRLSPVTLSAQPRLTSELLRTL
jgi:hypothetical protein